MVNLHVERSNRDRRSLILEVAAALFANGGFDSTSMNDVAAAAGIQKPSVYHHFSSKEEILVYILDDGISRLLSEADRVMKEYDDPRERLEQLLLAHIGGFEDKKAQVTVFLLERQAAMVTARSKYIVKRRQYDQLFVRTIKEGQRQGLFRQGNPTVMAYGILGMYNWLIQWFNPQGRLPLEEIHRTFVAMVMSGIKISLDESRKRRAP